MPYLLNPERGFIVTANNKIIDDSYIHHLNGPYMIDSRAQAIEEAIQACIEKGEKFDENNIMEKLLNIVKDPFCSDILPRIFNTIENDEKFKKIYFNSLSDEYLDESKVIIH